MKVSVERLRAAIHWYSRHCWAWMEQTKSFDYDGLRQQGTTFERLLAAWQKEVGDSPEGLPKVLEAYVAMSLSPVVTPAFNAGPADATATSSTAVEVAPDDDGTEATMLVTPNCNPGLGAKTPIELWSLALTKYKALEQCEEAYSNAKARDGDEAAESADQARAVALGNAVAALQDLGSAKVRERLLAFETERSGKLAVHYP